MKPQSTLAPRMSLCIRLQSPHIERFIFASREWVLHDVPQFSPVWRARVVKVFLTGTFGASQVGEQVLHATIGQIRKSEMLVHMGLVAFCRASDAIHFVWLPSSFLARGRAVVGVEAARACLKWLLVFAAQITFPRARGFGFSVISLWTLSFFSWHFTTTVRSMRGASAVYLTVDVWVFVAKRGTSTGTTTATTTNYRAFFCLPVNFILFFRTMYWHWVTGVHVVQVWMVSHRHWPFGSASARLQLYCIFWNWNLRARTPWVR